MHFFSSISILSHVYRFSFFQFFFHLSHFSLPFPHFFIPSPFPSIPYSSSSHFFFYASLPQPTFLSPLLYSSLSVSFSICISPFSLSLTYFTSLSLLLFLPFPLSIPSTNHSFTFYYPFSFSWCLLQLFSLTAFALSFDNLFNSINVVSSAYSSFFFNTLPSFP